MSFVEVKLWFQPEIAFQTPTIGRLNLSYWLINRIIKLKEAAFPVYFGRFSLVKYFKASVEASHKRFTLEC